MPTSTILNTDLIKNTITNNGDSGKVPYRWTHGANDVEMGDGLLVYSFIQFIRAKTCVCIGSGGGFIPRIMTQARRDMWEMGVFGGNNDFINTLGSTPNSEIYNTFSKSLGIK